MLGFVKAYLTVACRRQNFEVYVNSYHNDNMKQDFQSLLDGKQFLGLSMIKETAMLTTTIYKVGFWDLVNATGGGLGLFLGFSFLSTFDYIQKYFIDHWK